MGIVSLNPSYVGLQSEFEVPMLDIQTLRNELAGVAARLATRGYTLDTAKFEQLEAERKTIQTRTQELRAKRNEKSKMIGYVMGLGSKADSEDVKKLKEEISSFSDEQKQLEVKL